MSGNGAQDREVGNGDSAVPAFRGAQPLLPPPPPPMAAQLPALTVTPPGGRNSMAGDAWKEQEAAAERRAAGIAEPPPVYENRSASSSTQQTPAQQPRRGSAPSTADVVAAAVAVAQSQQNRQRSSSVSSPSEKRPRRDDRKWYSKKRTFLALTLSLVIILVVALVCNYVVFRNSGMGNGKNWQHRHGRGSENGTDVYDKSLLMNQNAAWDGRMDVLKGTWHIRNSRLDAGADGKDLDECAEKTSYFNACKDSPFMESDFDLEFFVNETSRGMFQGEFSKGIFDKNEAKIEALRPSKNGMTTNYDYNMAEGKKKGCGYGRGLQILLTSLEGEDGKVNNIYKITETQVISGDNCAAEGSDMGDVCTCTFIGKRDLPPK